MRTGLTRVLIGSSASAVWRIVAVDRPSAVPCTVGHARARPLGAGFFWRAGLRHAKSCAFALAAVGFVLAGFPILAQANHKVYSPVVQGDEWELEVRGHADFDDEDSLDGGQKQIYEIGYGVADFWFTSIFAELEEEPDGSLKYEAVAWENIIELYGREEAWLASGLYFELEAKDDESKADKLEFKLLLERELGEVVNTANINFEKELGNNADDNLEFEYAWRSKWEVVHHFDLGFEAYGELGEISNFRSPDRQEHQIGPMLYGEIELGEAVELEYRFGLLFGLTDATPDEVLVWHVELEF